ncbi:NUDIX hydrolase [Streptomyces lydicus]|uniref:NUDIX hydrolase n=1 Tax=Streptomyces lydicus TaxID=47763 RepID=UPI001012FA81|nr:NUDIX hydrolase [Streptomyces lydicus]MCZ1012103.1 NUDIX hydrolase [Streptomyces lydicus]
MSDQKNAAAQASTDTALTAEERAAQWQVFGERTIYKNRWVTVALADIRTPDGVRFEHHKVYLPQAAMVAMIDDQDRVLMMWRHRFVPDLWNYELPGGLLDAGEDPAVAAAREVIEETGYRTTGTLERVVAFEPMIGTVASQHFVFIARGVEKVGEPTEKNEAAHMKWVPLDDVLGLIAAGKIRNSGTLVAVLHLLAARNRA